MNNRQIYTGIHAALFDLDGVLLNSAADISASVNTALETFGCNSISLERIINYVGDGGKNLIERAVRFSLFGLDKYECLPQDNSHESVLKRKQFNDIMEKIYPWYSDYYRTHATLQSVLYPGVTELLEKLKQRGLSMGLVSNKPLKTSERILSYFHIDTYFDVIIGPELLKHIKPDPEGIFLALKKIDCEPVAAVMTGDTATDIQAARAAGTVSCAFTGGFGDKKLLLAENADIVISDLKDLAARIHI